MKPIKTVTKLYSIKTIANPIKTSIKLYDPRTGKYIIKSSFRFTHKTVKLRLPVMEDDDMEIKEEKDKEKEEKKEEKDELYKGLGSSFGAFINLDEEDKIGKKEKEILNYKRNRAKKSKRSIVGMAKKVRKVEPSTAQKVFNLLSKKDEIDDNAVITAASEAKYPNITQENINFFVGLGKARANLRKFGIPGTICKNPFHLFKILYPYDTTQIFTNDSNAINAYYWLLFTMDIENKGLREYFDLCKDSVLKDFSVVTDKTFICDSVLSGYVQDSSKKVSLICPKPLSQKEIEEFATAIENKTPGSLLANITNPSGGSVIFMQYKQVLIISPEKINAKNALLETANVKCVNSKNNLQSGLKDVKIDTNLGSYLNIHDIKTTDFSPSCLFISPPIKSPKMFINVELETNNVYDSIIKQLDEINELKSLKLPESCIFWDNIDSIVQMLSFIRLINKPKKDVDDEMLFVITKYLEYKNDISAWKRIYSSFETIVLSFYDKITNKLTIDSITALEAKVGKFISDFNNAKSNSGAYSSIIKLIKFLPGTKLMVNFIETNLSIELIYAIARLIAMLRIVEGDVKFPISDLFKTIGLTCANVLFDGSIPMIPKIRAKSAFLGGLMTDMTQKEYNTNIEYLVNSYKKNYVAGLKKDEGGVNVDDINQIDELVKSVVRNTINSSDSDYLQNNVEAIITKIMSDPDLFSRLRENIMEMKKLNSDKDIAVSGDFNKDETFMTYLSTLVDVSNAMQKAKADDDIDDVANVVKAVPENKEEKSARIKKFKTILKPPKKKVLFKVTRYDKKKNAVKIKRDKLKKVIKKNIEDDKQAEAEKNFNIIINDVEEIKE